MKQHSHEDAVALFREAVASPFVVIGDSSKYDSSDSRIAVWDWARHLQSAFPLWSFQPQAYAALLNKELPLTYPLRPFIRSIVRDEAGLEPSSEELSLQGIPALKLVIDGRRYGLSDTSSGAFSESVEESNGEFRFIGSFGHRFSRLAEGPCLAHYEPDTEYSTGGYISPYEDIGVRLANLVEDREAAPARSEEKRIAKHQLGLFLNEVALKVRGRPTSLPGVVAKRIVQEGSDLVELCWSALAADFPLSELTRRVFTSYSVPPSEMLDWAIRLTVPNFSALELTALRRRGRAIHRSPAAPMSHSRDFAVELLAHRLGRPAAKVARKVMHGWAAEMVAPRGNCTVCQQTHAD